MCVDEFIPFTGVWFSDVVPLTLQQHGADVVLALQQQKRVQITAQDAEQPWSNKHRQGRRQKKKTKCVKTQSGLAAAHTVHRARTEPSVCKRWISQQIFPPPACRSQL